MPTLTTPFGPIFLPPLPTTLPSWAVALTQELAQRVVLGVNHVLRAEPAATTRLQTHVGKTLCVEVVSAKLCLRVTPAGLLEALMPPIPEGSPDLRLTAEVLGPGNGAAVAWPAAPRWRVEGDADMAASFAWLAEHLRWDVQEDLARLVGPVPAQHVARVAQPLVDKVRQHLRTGLSEGRAL